MRLDRSQYDAKINYVATRKQTTWGKYSRMDAPVEGKYPFGDIGGEELGKAGKGETTTKIANGGFNPLEVFMMENVYKRFGVRFFFCPGGYQRWASAIWPKTCPFPCKVDNFVVW